MKGTDQKIILLIILICAVGALFRIFGLTIHSLWLDELQSTVTADPSNSFSEINKICKSSYDPSPPTFYYLLNIWFKLFGYSDFSARMLPALFGIFSIPLMYLLAKRLFNQWTGVLAALITSVNFFNIYYSLEVRSYALLFFFASASYLAFISLIEKVSLKSGIVYFVCTFLMIALHYFALLIFLTQILTWIVLKHQQIKQLRRSLHTILPFIAVLLAFIPFIPQLLKILHWESAGQFFDGDRYFMVFYFNLFFGMNGLVVFTALACVCVFTIAAFYPNGFKKLDPTNSAAFIIFSWLILPLLIAYARSLSGSSALAPRYAIVVLPPLLIMVAAGMDTIASKKIQLGLILLFIGGSFIKLFPDNHFYKANDKDDFKGVVSKIMTASENKKNITLISNRNWHLNYYFRLANIKPVMVDVKDLTDQRFIVSSTKSAQDIIADSTLVDIWVASANNADLTLMKTVSNTIYNSERFLKIDSFIGKEAFADHYIKKNWTAGLAKYNYLNGINIGSGDLILKDKQLMRDENGETVALWDGEVKSKPFKIKKGSYTILINSRGTMAHDSLAMISVEINGVEIQRYASTEMYASKKMEFFQPAEAEITLGLKLVNDLYDPATEEDRNVFIKSIVITQKQ